MKPKVEIPARPISAVNKLHRIKKNVFPSLLYNNNLQGILSNISVFDEHSMSPSRVNLNPNLIQANRVKSAKINPHVDNESLLQENLNLKSNLNKVRNELAFAKKEIVNLELEINKKDKMLDDLAMEAQNSMINNISRVNDNFDKNKILTKANETRLIVNLKKKYKEVKKELDKKNEQYEDLKKTLKATRLNEISQENAILIEEINKLKGLYEHSMQQNETHAHLLTELNAIKEINSKQEFIILNLQENLRKSQEENVLKDLELGKLLKIKNDKTNTIFKIKKDLKFQYQINEKLINSIENIKQNSEYVNMKSELEKRIQDLKKENSYYKEISDKRDKRVRELERVITQGSGQVANNNSININYFPPTSEENQEEKTNSKILLLQSKLLEEKNEKEKLLALIKDLNDQLKLKDYENEPHSIRSNDVKGNLIDYDYLSDHNLNEFIYVLIKNLEARRLDQNIIEARVLNGDTFELLVQDKEKEFTSKAANNLIDLLQIKNQQDIKDIHSFVKTFYYNNFAMVDNKDSEEFKKKFLSLFELINFYTVEQKQTLNKSLAKKLTSSKTILLNAMSFFDEFKSGYITFTTLKKIMERIKIHLKHELMEYFIFLMKSFTDDSVGLRDLKYENVFKMIDDNDITQEDQLEVNEEEEDEEENAIEITKEEYLAKVAEVIKKVAQSIKDSGKTIEDYFAEHVIPDINDFKAIELARLVQILRDEFQIELNHVDIFCLFTKIKPGVDSSENFEASESVEEIIDYDKLIKEIQIASKSLKFKEEIKAESKEATPNDQEEEYEETYENNSIAEKEDNANLLEEYSQPTSSNRKQASKKELLKFNANSINTNSKRSVKREEDFIDNMKKFLDVHNILYERFIFLEQNKMKLNYYTNDNDKKEYNRYLPLEIFEELLKQNNIEKFDPYNHRYNKMILCSNGMVNLDYIKSLLNAEETKQYYAYNPENEPNSDPANAKDVHDLNESPPSNRTKSNRSVEESDSFRKLKDEIMEDKEEEGYLVERDEASL